MSEHPYAGKIAQQRARERADAIVWRTMLEEPPTPRKPIARRKRKVAAAQ